MLEFDPFNFKNQVESACLVPDQQAVTDPEFYQVEGFLNIKKKITKFLVTEEGDQAHNCMFFL